MAQKKTVLVVDDDEAIEHIVGTALRRAGYEVIYAPHAYRAQEIFQTRQVDLIILDIMMPEMDGFTLCQWIRERSRVPVIMLTAKGSVNDIVLGFKAGADDYITKPFTIKELEARVEAIFRRMSWGVAPPKEKVIVIGEVSIDAESRIATLRGEEIRLTPMEFELLYYLMSHAGEIIDKNTLFREVWGYEATDGANLVEVGIRRLRSKIERDPSSPQYITTVRGFGYRFAQAAEASNFANPGKV